MRSTVYYVQIQRHALRHTITITVDNQEPIYVHFLAVTGSDTHSPCRFRHHQSQPGTYTTSATSNPITLTNAGCL